MRVGFAVVFTGAGSVAAVFCQTVGHRPENPTVMCRHSKENWVPDFLKRRPDVSADIRCRPRSEPEDLRQRTIDRVRRFLKAHVPMRAAAQ
jgi:hypothetical protein